MEDAKTKSKYTVFSLTNLYTKQIKITGNTIAILFTFELNLFDKNSNRFLRAK